MHRAPHAHQDRGPTALELSPSRRILPGLAGWLLLGIVAGCGIVKSSADDAGAPLTDATLDRDAGPDASVDAPDAMPQPAPTESRGLVSGAGRMTSTTYTFDVELGHPADQRPARGATHTLEANTAIKP